MKVKRKYFDGLSCFLYVSFFMRSWNNIYVILYIFLQASKFKLHVRRTTWGLRGDECNVGEWKTVENFQVSPTKNITDQQKTCTICLSFIKRYDFQNDDMFLALAGFDSVMVEDWMFISWLVICFICYLTCFFWSSTN